MLEIKDLRDGDGQLWKRCRCNKDRENVVSDVPFLLAFFFFFPFLFLSVFCAKLLDEILQRRQLPAVDQGELLQNIFTH